ncbi:hypothetical protein [Microvirga puerhi]|uniref:Tetratricopeptide repeat protein n=1 Tax=Microvirga puerhi TaxID=2876078 RepID=A0ABS7VUJ3_9HYPH|nr:hypothetical protein [Microvirga puerhi]MBZ6079248.1 hypothetical protein [Microvirga puerhi]
MSVRTYDVPANEAPFFNFAEKNPAQRAADEKLVADVLKTSLDRSKAASAAIAAGGRAFLEQRDLSTAAKLFNQAYLLDPELSGIYHRFAMIVAGRFKDYDYSNELFDLAARMKSPAPSLQADHGRMLLMAGRPQSAKAVLQQAVANSPEWAIPRMNLAWATLLAGLRDEACRLKSEVHGQDLDVVQSDLVLFAQKAGC